jgi:quinol monooxygenase YgiN
MQDPKDSTKFCIVERYEQESSQKYHLENPVSTFGKNNRRIQADMIVLEDI